MITYPHAFTSIQVMLKQKTQNVVKIEDPPYVFKFLTINVYCLQTLLWRQTISFNHFMAAAIVPSKANILSHVP